VQRAVPEPLPIEPYSAFSLDRHSRPPYGLAFASRAGLGSPVVHAVRTFVHGIQGGPNAATIATLIRLYAR
jgi:hypothetical protein